MSNRYKPIQRYRFGWTDPRQIYGSSRVKRRAPQYSRVIDAMGLVIGVLLIVLPIATLAHFLWTFMEWW